MIELKDVIDSKAYVKANVTYGSPKEYLGEFCEWADKLNAELVVRTAGNVENANDDSSMNTSYARVLVEAKIGSEVDGLIARVGALYALDTQKPVIKAFAGTEVRACTNLCVFNAEDMFVGSILDPGSIEKFQDSYRGYLDNAYRTFEQHQKLKTKLQNEVMSNRDVEAYIGGLLRYAISPVGKYLGKSTVSGAAEELFSSSGKYYIGKTPEVSRWQVYNAMTEMLKKADIADQAAKTVVLSKFMLN